MDYKALISVAKKSLKHAYAPYSKFRVGAALLTKSGRIFQGCNIENASYGLTVCAERAAVFNALVSGQRRFEAIAIVSSSKHITYPCGACLQVLAEFAPDIRIILTDGRKKVVVKQLRELLRYPFASHKLH